MKEGRCVEMVKSGALADRGPSRLIATLLISALFLLSGCERLKQLARQPEIVQKQQVEITRLNARIQSLELRLAGLEQGLNSQQTNTEQRFAVLDSSVNSLGTRYAVLDSNVNKHKLCIFQNDFKGVQRLDTDLGSVLVSLAGMAGSDKHHRLILNIGDPSTAEISEFTLRLTCGKPFNPSGSATYEDWQKSLKVINESFKKQLKPGQWNKIEVPLGELQPEDVKYITVQMTVEAVSLKQE